jgi:hypothetical protein
MVSIDLINLDLAKTELILKSSLEFERRFSVKFGEYGGTIRGLCAGVRAELADPKMNPQWHQYLVVDSAARLAVGNCGFLGEPDADGIARIIHTTYPDFEGQGYSIAMAKSLVEIAAKSGRVKRVLLDTSPKRISSSLIMEKLGFTLRGEVQATGESTVLRWERDVADSGQKDR